MKTPPRLHEPPRLLELDTLSAELKSDLSQAQQPLLYDHAQGLQVFNARLESGASDLGSGPNSVPSSESAETLRVAAAQMSRGAYWGLGSVGVAAVALVGAAVFSLGAGIERGVATLPRQGVTTGPMNAAQADEDAPRTQEGSLAEDLGQKSETLVAVHEPGMPEQAAAVPEMTTQASRSGVAKVGLKAEVLELRAIREQLATAPAQAVESLLKSPFRRSGRLQQERMALHIEALVQLGQGEEAQSLAAQFMKAYPSSPSVGRFRCVAEPSAAHCQ